MGLMRSLLELVLLSLLLRAGQVQAEERFPFQPQYVEMLAASPVPVRVIDKDQELPEKLTKTLSKVSDKIRSMENNLNEFTEEHDQDHSGIIKKKWEEHIKAPASSPTPYPSPQDDLSRDTSNRRAEKDMNTIDNYIHLDNEILETSKNDITKASPVDDNEAHSSLEILKDDISESSANASWTLETSTDDITESEEGSDYETDTSQEEQEYEYEKEENISEEETAESDFDTTKRTTEEATEEYHSVLDSNEDYEYGD